MYVPDAVPDTDRKALQEKGSFGNKVGMGSRVAVLNVDMTREFVADKYPNGFAKTGKPAVEAIACLMDAAQEYGIRGFYSRSLKGEHPLEAGRWSDTNPNEQDAEATELAEGLSPTDEDVVFRKYKPSVFFGTQLESMLNADSIDTVIVTGMTTSGCVRATVVDAFSLNYHVVIPVECSADRSQISHEISLFDMDMKYADVLPLDEVLAELEAQFD